MKVFFATADDTVIANEDPSFMKRLEEAAGSHDDLDVTKEVEFADLIAIDERYAYRTWAYADVLRSCPFVRRYASRIAVLNHDDHARVFLPGLYVSLEHSHPPLVPALPIPYKGDLWKTDVAKIVEEAAPRFLWTFRGASGTHPIRREIWRQLHGDPRGSIEILDRQLHTHSVDEQLAFARLIRSGAFSLCPRGSSPASYRIYESMQLGRCPVVISDDWTAPSGIVWAECSIRVPERHVRALPDILDSHKDAADQLGRRARVEWERRLSLPNRLHGFLVSLIDIVSLPGFGASFDQLSTRWGSRAFRSHYNWTLRGRLVSRIKREVESMERRRFGARLRASGENVGRSQNT